MTFYYDGQSICGGVTIAVTPEDVVIKWLDYIYSLVILPRWLTLWYDDDNDMLHYSVSYTLRLTGFSLDELRRQVRQWSHYDEIFIYNDHLVNYDPPISHWEDRSRLKKVALLLSLRCDVLSTVARRLLTK